MAIVPVVDAATAIEIGIAGLTKKEPQANEHRTTSTANWTARSMAMSIL
jgi:hypothetical protein